jgi:hypothetical protein
LSERCCTKSSGHENASVAKGQAFPHDVAHATSRPVPGRRLEPALVRSTMMTRSGFVGGKRAG